MKTSSNIFTVQIQPPPPPPPAFSPDGTLLSPTVNLTDSKGAVWTQISLIGGVAGQIGVAKNGTRVLQSVDSVTIKAGVIWVSDFKSGSGWQHDDGAGGWVITGNTGP